MERERIYCFRRSFVSESDNVIETLSWRLCLAPQSYRSWALGSVGPSLEEKYGFEIMVTPTYLHSRVTFKVDDYG
jgi:hypothetical protein